jgi:FSR family fosmidomycin resistance protein-like MFS transporter
MTTPQLTLSAPREAETRIIASVSAAHFVSHFFFLVLPPLFVFVRADYGLDYTELALAITVFNVVSAIFQTPTGMLADRFGSFSILIAGLLLGSLAFAAVALVHSYWFLLAMFALAGLANTVYHPANYSLLSHHVASERMGSAFSIHTFAGMLGGAIAPATMMFAQPLVGWRGAFIVAATLGLVVAATLALLRKDFIDVAHNAAKLTHEERAERRQLLQSWPILASFAFFTLQSAIFVGVQTFSPVALHSAFGTAITTGNGALSANMLFSAVGVLAGGVLVSRVNNHRFCAAAGLFVAGVMVLLTGTCDFGAIALVSVMSISGFATGVIAPSRDLLVREVTPPGAFGTVFGFVTTGFNISGVVFPLVFAALLDHGMPRAVFLLAAALCMLSILTVMIGKAGTRQDGALTS